MLEAKGHASDAVNKGIDAVEIVKQRHALAVEQKA